MQTPKDERRDGAEEDRPPRKQRETKDDGRYIIFFDFEDEEG